MSTTEVVTVPTSLGPARVTVARPEAAGARGSVVLGHGAGGDTGAADLQALLGLARQGWRVVLVDQPWVLAGRRVAPAPARLDLAWREVLGGLDARPGALPRPLVTGGRSAGARVACRTSTGQGEPALSRADGVLCLAFPLRPPRTPDRTRAGELDVPLAHGIPVLVVQGERDPFGSPDRVREEAPGATVVAVPGTHSPTRDLAGLLTHTAAWLDRVSGPSPLG